MAGAETEQAQEGRAGATADRILQALVRMSVVFL